MTQQQQQQTNVLSLSPRKRVLFVDATWYHKGQQPHQGRLDFEKGPRIPGSVYFDLSDICESNPDWLSYIANKNMTTKTATKTATTTNNNKDGQEEEEEESVQLSWMLPSRQLLDLVLDALVEGNNDNNNDDSMVEQKKKTKDWEQTHIIVYGQTFKGCSFIPRVWFTFWRLGLFARVSILNGTLEDDWTGPMELTSITVPWMKDILLPSSMDDKNTQNNKDTKRQEAQDDTPPLQQDKSIVVVKRDQVLQDANGDPTILLDARGSSFAKKGHIPGAIQIPYSTLMDHNNNNRNNNNRNKKDIVADSNNLLFKDREAMQTLFQQAGVDPTTKQTVVCSCGSGVSACSLYVALLECGRDYKNTFLYDGSWQEWSQIKTLPKVFPTSSSSSSEHEDKQ